MRPRVPAEQWLGRVVLVAVTGVATGYGGRLLLQGRIRGAQTQREDLAALPAPAHTERPRRRSLESPDLHLLCGERWQFFGTLTFKQERLPERVRQTMFHAALRQLAQTLRLYFPRLPWCRREELGDLLGRRHYHFLLTGLPARAACLSTCFFLMAAWEKIGGGMARVRLYRPGAGRPGVRDEVPRRRRRLRDFQVRGGPVAPHALRRALEIAPRPASDGREASCTTKHAASRLLHSGERRLTAGQWPVVTLQAVPGDRAGRASARPPDPRLLEDELCTRIITPSG